MSEIYHIAGEFDGRLGEKSFGQDLQDLFKIDM